jgi:hypothetical protein
MSMPISADEMPVKAQLASKIGDIIKRRKRVLPQFRRENGVIAGGKRLLALAGGMAVVATLYACPALAEGGGCSNC